MRGEREEKEEVVRGDGGGGLYWQLKVKSFT